MDEGQEERENPQANVQKALTAQQERIKSLETAGGFREGLTGKGVSGEVTARYNKDRGGQVSTQITSGDASLYQDWTFDNNGKLLGVRIQKFLGGNTAGEMTIIRNENGKLQVTDFNARSRLRSWEEEFAKAGKNHGDQTA